MFIKNGSKVLCVALGIMGATVANAQDYPPNAEPGKCYAKCMIPDQYETTTNEVLVKQATQRLEISPAQYETVEEQIESKAAASRLEVIPAVYETVTDKIEIKPASFRLEPVPAVYETVTEKIQVSAEKISLAEVPGTYETTTEQIEISPAATKWVKRKGDRNCLSQDPNDCLVWCLVEVAAQYRTVTKTIMKTAPTTRENVTPAAFKTVSKTIMSSPPTTRRVEIPAVYKTITKTIVVKPAETRTIDIPAQYRTVKKTVVVKPASSSVIEIPAQYNTVSDRRLVKTGGFSEWREVLCQNKVNSIKIKEIQAALKSRGYDPGPIDDVMGSKTKNALVKFQKDNGLPVGQLDFETLKALGVSY